MDVQLTTSGIVWEGGYFSMDGVDVRDGRSAANFDVSACIPSMDTGAWYDEMTYTTYIAAYSREYPLVIKGLIQDGTASFVDDMWEVIQIDETTFYSIIANISQYMYDGVFKVNYTV